MRKGRIHTGFAVCAGILLVLLARFAESVQWLPASSESNAVRDINVFGQPSSTVFSAWGDYDLDGDLDLYVVNSGSPNNLYRNNLCSVENPCGEFNTRTLVRSPSFTRISVAENLNAVILKDGVSASRHAQWVDYDQDGDLDLYLVNDGMNRLFINNLFTPENPFDPFSDQTLSQQVQVASGGTYNPNQSSYTASFSVRYTQTMELELQSRGIAGENMLPVFERDLLAAGVQNPLVFPALPVENGQTNNNIFTDLSLGSVDNFVTKEVSPGMYLELIENGVTTKRFVILEVLGPNSLRADFEGSLQISGIFRYRIMRDAEFELRDTDRFVNEFTIDGAPLGNQAYYKYTGFPEGTSQYNSFQLTSSYLDANDQLIISLSSSPTQGKTLVKLLQVAPKQFGVEPIPVLANQPVESNFTMIPRRAGGAVLTQKLFVDTNLNPFQLATLQPGDRIEFLSGANKSKIVTIASISEEGVLFLDSQPGSLTIVPENNILYEFIYEAASTKTRRIFTDGAANFGVTDQQRATNQIPQGLFRDVKKGDWIVLDPVLDQPDIRLNAPPRVISQPLGSKATFSNGQPRPGAVLEVLDIVGQTQLLVDAYPSEVGLSANFQNKSFPYQIRHRFGRLKKNLTDPTATLFTLFDENSPQAPLDRDFSTTLQLRLQATPERNPYLVLSNAGANASVMKVFLAGYSGSNVFKNIRLSQGISVNQLNTAFVPSQSASLIPTLEYRFIYNGIGGVALNQPQGQQFVDKRKMRLIGLDLTGMGFARGHEIALLYRNPRVGPPNPVGIRKTYRVLDFVVENASSTVVTISEDLDAGTVQEIEQLCNQAGTQFCNPADPTLVNQYFSEGINALSVEYELLTTQGFDVGGAAIELGVTNETSLITRGFSLPQLGLQALDAIEFVPNLFGPSANPITVVTISGYRNPLLIDGSQRPVDQLTDALLDIKDASVVPFDVDLTETRIGIKPVFAGVLNKNGNTFNQVTISNPQLNLTSLAVAGDYLAWYSANAQGALTLTTRVPISRVTAQTIQVSRRLDAFTGLPPSSIGTNPFYFRITRAAGKLEQKPAFRDEREELDFRQKLRLNADDTVRGVVLLDLYKTSTLISDPIYKRFKVNSVISRNVLELESINAQEDTFVGYFYEIKSVERNAGDIIEHNSGNGIRASFADYNLDGIPDLYLLNQATNSSQPLISENGVPLNRAVMLLGSRVTLAGTTQPVYRFVQPAQSIADQDIELRNQPGQTQDPAFPVTEFLVGVDAKTGDMDGDRRPDLLIANRDWPDRLFLSRATEEAVDARPIFLRSQGPADGAVPGDLKGLNSPDVRDQFQLMNGVLIGDMDRDSRDDVYLLAGDSLGTNLATRNRNAFFLSEENTFRSLRLVSGNSAFDEMEVGESVSGAIADLDYDGFQDISILNQDALHIVYPYLQAGSSLKTPVLSTVPACARLEGTGNRSIQWVDVNHDGWLDFYVSRGGASTQTNVLCLSNPLDVTTEGNFFAFELLPRQLKGRTDRKFTQARITLSGTDASGSALNLQKLVPYSYPHPSRVLVGAGSMKTATVVVDWNDDSRFAYGVLPAQMTTASARTWHVLTQPDDYDYVPLKSGSLAQVTTVVASKTTNIEAVGGTIFGSTREDLIFDSLRIFLSTNFPERTAAAINQIIPQGTLKLYLDNSVAGQASTTIEGLVPNGIFDGNSIDWLISSTTVTSIELDQAGDFTQLLNVDGVAQAPTEALLQAHFTRIGFSASTSPAVTDGPIILSQVRAGTVTSNLSFLMVYSIDKPIDPNSTATSTQITFTPYLPARKAYGFEGTVGTTSRWDKTMDVVMRGKASSLIYRADYRLSQTTSYISPVSQRGVSAGVDEIPPQPPVIGQDVLPSSTRTATNLIVRGTAEDKAVIRARNLTNGSLADVVQTVNGIWQIIIPQLQEGNNRLEFVAVDEYGNVSDPSFVEILLDTRAPQFARAVVTNINLTKALVSFETPLESSFATVILRSDMADSCSSQIPANRLGIFGCDSQISALAASLSGKVIQCYGSDQNGTRLLRTSHTIPVGISKANFGLQIAMGKNPLGLCPDTSYQVDLLVQDSLGNFTYTSSALAAFQTLPESLIPADSDGDGIPDSIEFDTQYPDLDPYDANDALLDFDGDGINNVEEYKAGTNMYDPFDNSNLPIPNAGVDRVGEFALKPGIVELDASSSSFNGVATSAIGYQWRIVSVPNLPGETAPPRPTLNNATSSNAWFVARRAGIYTVELVLFTDKQAVTQPDQALVEIRNEPPQAILPRSQNGLVGQTLPLDGRRTLDANVEPLNYRWVQTSGPDLANQAISDPAFGMFATTSALANFRPGRVGRYVFELVATDNAGASDRARLSYFVNSINEVFPTANAGPDQLIRAGDVLELQGDRSRGRTQGTSLIYNWQPISSALPEIALECSGKTYKSPILASALSGKRPRLVLSEPGLYAFNLTVREDGKGLLSEPDCMEVQVLPVARPMPQPGPRVVAIPSRSQGRTLSLLKAVDSGSSVYRMPVNFTVRLDGGNSFLPTATPLISIQEGQEATIRSTSDCTFGAGSYPYRWSQVEGRETPLVPLSQNCSTVSFTPVEPGVYVYELVLWSSTSLGQQPSMPSSLVIVVNDPSGEVGNRAHVPYVEAASAQVRNKGQIQLSAPSCVDEDVAVVSGASSVGEHVYPQNALQSCSALGLQCQWRQIEGPPVVLSGSADCSPGFNALAGTYRFSVQVNDGTLFSVPDFLDLVVTEPGQRVPQAAAGGDISTTADSRVYLDGSFSIASGTGLSYLWKQSSGVPVVFTDASSAKPSFIPPVEGQYRFSLQVLDGANGLLSLPDEVNVLVNTSTSQVLGTGSDTDELVRFEQEGGGGGGGCYIVTAASGSSDSFLVLFYQSLRDEFLLQTDWGTRSMRLYYQYSPALARPLEDSPLLQGLSLLILVALALGIQFPWLLFMLIGPVFFRRFASRRALLR